MTKPVSKFFLILAASDLSDRELGQVASWLERNGISQLRATVQSLRSTSDYIDDSVHRSAPVTNYYLEADEKPGKAAEQIDNLLRLEAGLSTSQAGEALLDAIRRHVPPGKLPRLGKESFAVWLQKLSKFVPYSVLLHEATVIRNKAVHSYGTDWPLKNR